ncbi:Ribokinase-like protein, partial [Microthyrium microscopicum]
ITILGSLNMDMVTVTNKVPGPGETVLAESFSTGCGGKGANQAVAAARLTQFHPDERRTAGVQMIGAVGCDDFGVRLKEGLQKSGVDVEFVKEVSSAGTGTATITVEKETGENRIMVVSGANQEVVTADQLADEFDYGKVLLCQLECPVETVLGHLKRASRLKTGQNRTKTILNPSPTIPLPKETFKFVDYLVVNETEGQFYARELGEKDSSPANPSLTDQATTLLEYVNSGVIITLGGRGVYYAKKEDGEIHTAILAATEVEKVVDTTAAGDTFVGAFASWLARGDKKSYTNEWQFLETAIQFGQDAAAWAVQRPGAQDSIP